MLNIWKKYVYVKYWINCIYISLILFFFGLYKISDKKIEKENEENVWEDHLWRMG